MTHTSWSDELQDAIESAQAPHRSFAEIGDDIADELEALGYEPELEVKRGQGVWHWYEGRHNGQRWVLGRFVEMDVGE